VRYWLAIWKLVLYKKYKAAPSSSVSSNVMRQKAAFRFLWCSRKMAAQAPGAAPARVARCKVFSEMRRWPRWALRLSRKNSRKQRALKNSRLSKIILTREKRLVEVVFDPAS
jgi:hypothetical protein